MTIREIIESAGAHQIPVAVFLGGIPVMAFVVAKLHGRGSGGQTPWKYLYSLLVYAASVPGILAAMLTLYAMMFVNMNLLDADALVYFLPIISMVSTLMIISRNVDFDDVPGFDRLSGLMVMLGMTFVALLFIQKTRIWIVFGGGFGALFLLAGLVFALLKWGAYMAFRRRDEPKIDPPSFSS